MVIIAVDGLEKKLVEILKEEMKERQQLSKKRTLTCSLFVF
jgi:hypothetical protein